MENPMTFQQHYADHQRQAAWINENDWQFEPATRGARMRNTVAKVLIALAARLTPTPQTSRTATNA